MHCLTIRGKWAVQFLQRAATVPRGIGQCNICNTLPHRLGAVGSATPAIYCPGPGAVGNATLAMHCLTAWGQWAVDLLLFTTTFLRGSGQWNSRNAIPYRVEAVGSATSVIHCLTAWGHRAMQLLLCTTTLLMGQWAVQLLQYTATPPGGGGHCNSCNARAHQQGGRGVPPERWLQSSTRAMHCHTTWVQWAVQLLRCTASLPGGTGSQAAAKRKMGGVPPLSKAELPKVRELDAKPQRVYASPLALSTLLWRREVLTHEYVSRFRDKDKFTDVTVDDLAPVMDCDAAVTQDRCLESMSDDEIDRLKAFVLAVWTFTLTSPSAYRGKRGLGPKGAADKREAEDDEPSLPVRSQGCTGAAEEEVVARRLAAMKAKLKIEGDRRLYTTKPGAELMDVKSAPVTACRACKNVGRSVKHHWFHE